MNQARTTGRRSRIGIALIVAILLSIFGTSAPVGAQPAGDDSTTADDGTVVRDQVPPVVLISRPGPSHPGGALQVGGYASAAAGINRVLVAIRDITTRQFWNGTTWQAADIWIESALANAGGTTSEWSLSLTTEANPLYIAARGVDRFNTWGDPVSINTAVAVVDPNRVEPPPLTEPDTSVIGAGATPTGPAALCAGPVKVGLAIDLYSHSTASVAYDPAYDALAANQFCHVSSENSLKRSYLENDQGDRNLGIADAYVATGERYGASMRGHSLVWNYRDPAYLGGLTPAELSASLDDFITEMMTRYPQIESWDVVNEPLNWNGHSWWAGVYDGLETGGYPPVNATTLETTAPKHVLQAFATADRVRTQNNLNTTLWLNESNVLDPGSPKYGDKTEAMYQLAKWMVANNIPIDGVGFQAHLRVEGVTPTAIWGSPYEVPQMTPDTVARICGNLKRYKDLGLEVALTEVDVVVPLNATPAQLQSQTDAYKLLYQVAAEVDVTDFTIWGLDDERSFYNKPFQGGTVVPEWGNATLFDKDLQSKPVYDAFSTFVAGYNTSPPPRVCPT